MANFSFLKDKPEYRLFAEAAIEAEAVYAVSPAMCAAGCRRALELAVKWVYAADSEMKLPYADHLQALIHETNFRFAVDRYTWGKLPFIIKLGNLSMHRDVVITKSDALVSLQNLFEFILWVDYCYGKDYRERSFCESEIPKAVDPALLEKMRAQETEIAARDLTISHLREEMDKMAFELAAAKEANMASRTFQSEEPPSEFETRKVYIDVDLKLSGWRFEGPSANVSIEYDVDAMGGKLGKHGACDYVLWGRDGKPLAVLEAKKTSLSVNDGRRQAVEYADALEMRFGRRPMIFLSNGFETKFWDEASGPDRDVFSVFSAEDLERLMLRRGKEKDLSAIPVSPKITDRYYQIGAIRAVCEKMGEGFRKFLLVMATGTGKTRTAASLCDVLLRGNAVTNILFLADRTALVKQAKDDFKNYLPNLSLCNLCENKDDFRSRIVFSTYPTILNAIDEARSADGARLFSPAHFDLIIIDESHRSIFKKYKDIFRYFDARLVGLTATPKTEVARNTYEFFEMETGVPTYAYDYETAVEKDHVLVPFYNYEVSTEFTEKGIVYDTLTEEEKEKYDEDFGEDAPDVIPSAELNKFVFNAHTVDLVLQDLMERGMKVAGGERIGKTIIFAQNKRHADFILERFNALYPMYKGKYADRVVCDDRFAQDIIDDFKQEDKPPFIVISVDMMDTGIDVPSCVNLVFFKKVRSRVKFWQMIGRGTRLCPDLLCVDPVEGEIRGKKRFLIFDYCGNFEFFRQKKEGIERGETMSLSESIFGKKVRLLSLLQESRYAEDPYPAWRASLAASCEKDTATLNPELISVRAELRYVEKYQKEGAFAALSEGNVAELLQHVARLVKIADEDEAALRFDNFMYGLMLAAAEVGKSIERHKQYVMTVAEALAAKSTIPQVREKLPLLKRISEDAFWDTRNLAEFENVRRELRGLIRFLDGDDTRDIIFTNLTDTVTKSTEGEPILPADNFENYKKKVNRYIEENRATLVIYKLTHNEKLSAADFKELERILTQELGSRADYEKEYGDTPFGLLVRKIAKLDHEAAMQAFSSFINDESLNARQIEFVNKIISYIEQNGYMEDINVLMRPPFDRPISFVRLFDPDRQKALAKAISEIRENALTETA